MLMQESHQWMVAQQRALQHENVGLTPRQRIELAGEGGVCVCVWTEAAGE